MKELSCGLTLNQFKTKYKRLYNHIAKMYSPMFDGMRTPIEMWLHDEPPPVCSICGVRVATIPSIRAKKDIRCKVHHRLDLSTAVTVEQFLERWEHPPHYYLNETWAIPKPLAYQPSIMCTRHGPFHPAIARLLNGGGCMKCYGEDSAGRSLGMPYDEWLRRSIEVHGNKYDYSKSNDYINCTYDVTIICPTHGELIQNAGVHMRGHGCGKCGINYDPHYGTSEYIDRAVAKHGDRYDYSQTEYTGARNPVTIICSDHGPFEQVAYYHLNGNGCQKCGMENEFKSKAEFEIVQWLESNGIEVVHSWYDLGFEVDIYIPEFKIGIEYDGIYWHSSKAEADDGKYRPKHLFKTKRCEAAGVQLFHIFENEWLDAVKNKIWKSLLLSKMQKSVSTVYARKAKLLPITTTEAKEFMNNNHLQGHTQCNECYGLYYDGELVFAMTFATSRFRKDKSTTEIVRAASKVGYNVVGGFGKILKHYTRNHTGLLVSYANRRWSMGNVYSKLGFTHVKNIDPCYFWIRSTNDMILYHRSKFMKHTLEAQLPVYDANLTEAQNMYNNGYSRIWDSGNMVFEMTMNGE